MQTLSPLTRRRLLRQLAAAAPMAMLPGLLAACGKDEGPAPAFKGSVIIIGAGASGLYAGQLLAERGLSVTILEASNAIGGRIKPLEGWSAPFPLELGAEEVHGNNSIWYRAARQYGGAFKADNTTDYQRIGLDLLPEDQANRNANVAAVRNLVAWLEEAAPADVPDVSVAALAAQRGVLDTSNLLDALLGNEYGTDNQSLGARGVAEGNQAWTAGEGNYSLSTTPLLQVLRSLCPQAVDKVQLHTPVVAINYQDGGARVADARGQIYQADRCLITTSVGVLRSGSIAFTPALPQVKQDALRLIGFGPGMKILLRFSSRFWPADLGSLYIPGTVPEFWSPSTGQDGGPYVLTAFVHGTEAASLSAMGADAVDFVVGQLFGTFPGANPRGLLVSSHIEDWGKNPYVRGTYSYPVPGGTGARNGLAAPVAGRLFFAGEATHTGGHFGTVHGAIETAERAVAEILRS